MAVVRVAMVRVVVMGVVVQEAISYAGQNARPGPAAQPGGRELVPPDRATIGTAWNR
jgi:hypothetical protein